MLSSGFLLFVSMVILSTSLSSSYMFNVGGRNGWGVRRSPEHYNAWSNRTRFQINDTLRKFNPINTKFAFLYHKNDTNHRKNDLIYED